MAPCLLWLTLQAVEKVDCDLIVITIPDLRPLLLKYSPFTPSSICISASLNSSSNLISILSLPFCPGNPKCPRFHLRDHCFNILSSGFETLAMIILRCIYIVSSPGIIL